MLGTRLVTTLAILAVILLVGRPAFASVCATDALGQPVCLDRPAKRIVSLSPGTTELLFSAGAGDAVVAVSAWSDYPAPARSLPQVGDSHRLDLERIVALRPDLVVAWTDGNSRAQLDRIAALGIPVFWLAPRSFEDIAVAVETLATLAGQPDTGRRRAQAFRAGIDELRQRYAGAEPVRVFYQVWDQPLMTVNGDELISKAIALCGGRNLFADLPRLVPRVTVEAVVAADPELIVTAGTGPAHNSRLAAWRAFPGLAAVAGGHLYLVTPSLLQRPTLRMLDGARELCDLLERARG